VAVSELFDIEVLLELKDRVAPVVNGTERVSVVSVAVLVLVSLPAEVGEYEKPVCVESHDDEVPVTAGVEMMVMPEAPVEVLSE